METYGPMLPVITKHYVFATCEGRGLVPKYKPYPPNSVAELQDSNLVCVIKFRLGKLLEFRQNASEIIS